MSLPRRIPGVHGYFGTDGEWRYFAAPITVGELGALPAARIIPSPVTAIRRRVTPRAELDTLIAARALPTVQAIDPCAAGAMRTFLEVADVLNPTRIAANYALSIACDALDLNGGLERQVRWYAPPDAEDDAELAAGAQQHRFEAGADWHGFIEGNFGKHHELWIRTSARPTDVAGTVAHEARHSWQVRTLGPGTRPSAPLELDAARYAKAFTARWATLIAARVAAER